MDKQYSNNPKMDKSGIKADVAEDKDCVVTGGALYLDALRVQRDFHKERVITDPESLRATAKMLGQGYVLISKKY